MSVVQFKNKIAFVQVNQNISVVHVTRPLLFMFRVLHFLLLLSQSEIRTVFRIQAVAGSGSNPDSDQDHDFL
jgi:hypothetical protein